MLNYDRIQLLPQELAMGDVTAFVPPAVAARLGEKLARHPSA